jgi:hypothetical protein
VNEQILAAVVGGNESEPLLVIEPLHGSAQAVTHPRTAEGEKKTLGKKLETLETKTHTDFSLSLSQHSVVVWPPGFDSYLCIKILERACVPRQPQ